MGQLSERFKYLDKSQARKWNNRQNSDAMIGADDGLFSVIKNSIRPKVKCPVEAGSYTLENATVDMRPYSFFPLDGNVWVFTFKIIEEKSKNVQLCMNSQWKFERKRVKN